jgi:NAD-dependent DNA ligase
MQEAITKRTHNTEHNHPDLVGTLDKCKFVLNKDAHDAGCFNDSNVKILERDFFQDHIDKGIIDPNQEIEIVCELKYDGISVEADCGTELYSARTRGDTGIGAAADITPILQGYRFKQADVMMNEEPLGVKFEAIITKDNLEIFNKLRGRNYSNCRTAIVGLFGASDGYMFRDLITLVPLAVDRDQTPWISNRIEEIHFINKIFRSHGEPLRYCYFKGSYIEILYYIKQFLIEASACRNQFNFMYDGIVVSYLDEGIRKKLGRKNYINKYSVAVKFDPLEKQTIVRGVTYEIGQHGQVTPMIHYDPVEFIGTIHTKSTGSSLKRFNELNLKYGDYINVTYVNDVMPYVTKLDCEHNRNNPNPKLEFTKVCPICGTLLTTSSSGDTAICPNRNCVGRNKKRMVNMFTKLNIKGFAEASFESLSNINSFHNLYDYNKEYYIDKLGEADGASFYNNLMNIKSDKIKDYMFMGSLGFTGIAHKKWKSIFEKVSIKELYHLWEISDSQETFNQYLSQYLPDGITKDIIVEEFPIYAEDINFAIQNNLLIDSRDSGTSKKQIRFSGVRNLQLMELLNTRGYDADEGSVTKKTDILLIPYEGFSSNKVNKALSQDNTIVVPINEFMDHIEKYLGEKL